MEKSWEETVVMKKKTFHWNLCNNNEMCSQSAERTARHTVYTQGMTEEKVWERKNDNFQLFDV